MEPTSDEDRAAPKQGARPITDKTSSASDSVAPEALAQPELAPPSRAERLADGTVRQLPERLVNADRLASLAVSLPIGIALSAVGFGLAFGGPLDGGQWWIPLPVLALIWMFLLFRMIRWPVIHHRHLSWSLTPLRIEIGAGVIWQGVTSVPRTRVQHTDVAQGPIQRRFGLATLSIHTAGSDAAQVDLHGLEYEDALAIRDYLILHEPREPKGQANTPHADAN